MKTVAPILGLCLTVTMSQVACSNDWARTQYEDYRTRTTELDSETIVAGLKQALQQGVERGVSSLGRADGYLKNGNVQIPVPDNLRTAEMLLRKVGADKYADQFILTLNRAAEAAVPQAKAVFLDVIRKMTVTDAIGILRGADDAATQYFRRQSQVRLAASFRPIVARATDKVGVTAQYKSLVSRVERLGFVDTSELDLDDYVTAKALDGLFYMMAQEEMRIRRDPVARTTELLRRVFG